jgi:hypothetical protein
MELKDKIIGNYKVFLYKPLGKGSYGTVNYLYYLSL